jgi:eukaryotic-like serine/threonine-protein kinase
MPDRAIATKKLGRYDILRVLGKGAMGVVYEALDPNLDRRVAIKTVRMDSLAKDEADEYELRFRTEAHSAARLQHPNIVSVYDSDRDGDTPFLVMEFVKGEDLKHYLDSGQRYTLEQSVRIMRDLLAALDYAHQHKIIHRDIKPANLLIEANGRVKLTDFGVARIQDSGEATKTQGGMVGTLKYMSPEQVEGKSVGAASDIFSAGVVLYQLLTDRRPFDGDSYFSIVNQITNQNPPAPSSINQMLPPAVDAVVARALAKSKTERFATAQDFAAALQAAARRADPTITPSANPYKIIEPLGTGAHERSGSTASMTSATSGTSGSTITQELELVYWKDVKDSNDTADLQGYLKRFPEGVYADLAKRQLKRIGDAKTAQGESVYENTQAAQNAADPLADDLTMVRHAVAAKPAVSLKSPEPDLEATTPMAHIPSQASDATDRTVPNALETPKSPSTHLVDSLDSPLFKTKPLQDTSAAAAKPPVVASPASPAKRSKAGLLVGLGLAALVGAGALVWALGSSKTVDPAVNATLPAVVPPELSASAAAATTVTTSPFAALNPTPTPDSVITPSLALPTTPVVTPTVIAAPLVSPPAIAIAPSMSSPTLSTSVTGVKTPKLAASAAKPKPPRDAASLPIAPTFGTGQATTITAPSAAASAPKPAPPPERTPSSPREACEGRVLFGFASCMSEQCSKSGFQNHPTCVERREQEERRRAIEQNR